MNARSKMCYILDAGLANDSKPMRRLKKKVRRIVKKQEKIQVKKEIELNATTGPDY